MKPISTGPFNSSELANWGPSMDPEGARLFS